MMMGRRRTAKTVTVIVSPIVIVIVIKIGIARTRTSTVITIAGRTKMGDRTKTWIDLGIVIGTIVIVEIVWIVVIVTATMIKAAGRTMATQNTISTIVINRTTTITITTIKTRPRHTTIHKTKNGQTTNVTRVISHVTSVMPKVTTPASAQSGGKPSSLGYGT